VSATPTVLAQADLDGLGEQLRNPFGPTVGLMDINYFDGQANSYIAAHSQIVPDSLPIFVTDNLLLTSGGCCIGGYHSADRPSGLCAIHLYHHGGRFLPKFVGSLSRNR